MSNKLYISILLTAFVVFQSTMGISFGADPNEVQKTVPIMVQKMLPNRVQKTDPNRVQYVMNSHINPEDAKVTLDFQDVTVSEVLDYLSQVAGLVVIADTYPTGRINLVSKQPLNIDEVVQLINTVLKEKGYAAIRTGRTLKIVSVSDAKYMNLPVTVGKDPDQIADSDEIITHVIPIRYANAVRLAQDLQPLLSSDTILTSNEASNSLIITDTQSNIKRLVKIVRSIDTQMSVAADVRVFLLDYADAENTANLINNVFKQQTETGNQSQQNRFSRMMGNFGRRGGGQNNQQSETSGVASNIPVIADADERTNAVVVSGPSDVLPVIEKVVKGLDANPSEERSLFVYNLKYAQASNIADRLNSIFKQLENINQQNLRNTGGFGGRGGATTRGTSSSSGDISDEVYIEADSDTNTLVVMTSSKNYEKIEKVIKDLDVPTPQVLIKVLIAELTTSNGQDIGIDWTLTSAEQSNGNSVTNLFDYNPKADEGLRSVIIQGDLNLTLRALATIGNLNVLSRPYIMTSNNQQAKINVGQRYPFVTNSTITEAGNTNNTVDYENIGITLTVTPTINVDSLVIMDVNPEITTAQEDTVKISDQVNATIFSTRSAQCRVAVPNGETVVIGGLMEDNETKDAEKIPLLGDLPLLGAFFTHTKTDNTKTELLIFLTPQVARNAEDLKKISDFERGKSKFLKEMEGTSLQDHVKNMESVYMENPLAK